MFDGEQPDGEGGREGKRRREEPRQDATAALETGHHTPRDVGHRNRHPIHEPQQAQCLFPLHAQLGRQLGGRDVAVEQLLH